MISFESGSRIDNELRLVFRINIADLEALRDHFHTKIAMERAYQFGKSLLEEDNLSAWIKELTEAVQAGKLTVSEALAEIYQRATGSEIEMKTLLEEIGMKGIPLQPEK